MSTKAGELHPPEFTGARSQRELVRDLRAIIDRPVDVTLKLGADCGSINAIGYLTEVDENDGELRLRVDQS